MKIGNNNSCKLIEYFSFKILILLGNINHSNIPIVFNENYMYFVNFLNNVRSFDLMGDLKEKKYLLYGKNIIGISALANILAKFSYSNGYKKIFKGIGLINAKTFCHFDGNKQIIDNLNNTGNKVEIIALKDKEYKIINI